MSKYKIRNSKLRTLAGAGLLITTLAIGLVVCYLIGQLGESLYATILSSDYENGYSFWESSAFGFYIVVVICIICSVICGLFKGSQWLGEKVFNSLAEG